MLRRSTENLHFIFIDAQACFAYMTQNGHINLKEHVASCRKSDCPCREFLQRQSTFPKLYPLVPDSDCSTESWLQYYIDGDKFRWFCVVCAKQDDDVGEQIQNTYKRGKVGPLKVSNLNRHQNSPQHKTASTHCLNLSLAKDPESASPSIAMFKGVFQRVQEGVSPSMGYCLNDGTRLGKDKTWKCLWILFEAVQLHKRKDLWLAIVINLLRDERHSRMHVRFRMCDEMARSVCGFLGQSRHATGTSIGIHNATLSVIRRACTKWHGFPKRFGGNVAPRLDEDLIKHVSAAIEAVTVDCADNELASVRDLSVQHGSSLPNCKYILRDAAHEMRRILQRPWKADKVMDGVMHFCLMDRDSIGQLIQHSGDLAKIYEDCTKASENLAISSSFKNLRAAKHRIESEITPLSRMVLNPEGFFAFAVKLTIIRKGTRESRIAIVFLSTVSEEMLILLSMMADGGSEALDLIRFLDTESVDVALICHEIEMFLDRIVWLFHHGGCMQVFGHTAAMCKWLETPHYFITSQITGKKVGGISAELMASILDKCYDHMRAWTLLVRDVLKAQFPQFELVNAFSVFGCIDPGRSIASSRSHKKLFVPTITDSMKQKMARLSKTFAAPMFEAQFRESLPYAVKTMRENGSDCELTWQATVRYRAQNNKANGDLMKLVQRLVVFTPSTSKIESSFSSIAKILVEERLNMDEDTENMIVTLLMAAFSDAELVELCHSARELWEEAFPGTKVRAHYKARADLKMSHDVSRKSEKDSLTPTEREFRKRLHSEIIASASSSSFDSNAVLDRYDAEPVFWTASHQKERQFNAEKRNTRLVEAHLTHMTLASDVDQNPGLHMKAVNEVARRSEALEKRRRQADRINRATNLAHKLTHKDLYGHKTSVDESVWCADIQKALHSMECIHVKTESEANLFVVGDPFATSTQTELRTKWAAALIGGKVCTPAVITQKRSGPLIQYKCALDTRRSCWASLQFRSQHPRLWLTILATCSNYKNSKWKLIDEVSDYVIAKNKAMAAKEPASVAALLTTEEKIANHSTSHVYDHKGFLDFIAKFDEELSVLGLADM